MPTREGLKIDFLLITALEEERKALLAALPECSRKLNQSRDDIRVYYETNFPLTAGAGYRVVTMSVSAMGRVKAAIATANALQRWRPSAVLLVGIAGGINAQGVRLGDVLLADQVVDFELQKLTKPAQGPRFQVHPTDARLLEAAHNISLPWQPNPRLRPERGSSAVHFGPVATGDKVVALRPFLARLMKSWPRLLGVEMEAGGVATACFQAANPPRFLMVRGVSDLADERKGTPSVERWRHLACVVAARYAVTLIRSAPFPVSTTASRKRNVPRAVPETPSPVAPPSQTGKNGLELWSGIFSGFSFLIPKDEPSHPIVNIHLRNRLLTRSFDDVVIELRLPARIAFVKSEESGKENKPVFGRVVIPVSQPIHPGADLGIGYVKEHCDLNDLTAGMFGATQRKDELEWKITARDVPAATGTLDITWLKPAAPTD